MKAIHFTFILVVLFMLNFISCDRNEKDVCDAINCNESEVCIGGECFDTLCLNTICHVCGDFVGEMDGEMDVFNEIPAYYTDLPFLMEVSELSSICTYTVSFDVSPLLGAPTGTLVPEANGTFLDSTITISNHVYVYQGIATITVNGIVNYSSDFNEVNGSLDLTVDAVGTITFVGVRQ